MKVTQIYLLLNLILTTSVLVDTLSVTGFMSNLWKRLSFQGSCDSLKFNAEGEDVRHVNGKEQSEGTNV